MEKVVFLDTNCYMHYRPIEEIDWEAVLGGSPVRIVLPRVVMNELDKHKDSHPQSKMKERVRRTLRHIEEWEVHAGPANIRPGVTRSSSLGPRELTLMNTA